MSISSVSSVSFKGNENTTVQRQKGGAGKAVASFFIPGLGEFLDSRNKEGAIFLGSRLGTGILAGALRIKLVKNACEAVENNVSTIKGYKLLNVAIGLLGLASFGLTIANIVDAYKGGSDKKVDQNA